jgi:hypothetical protein
MLIHKDSFKVFAVASKEASRPQLNGVHVSLDGTCEATNGHCLVRVHNVTASAEDFPVPSKGWTPPEVPAEGFIVPTEDAKACAALPPKKQRLPFLAENVLLESLNGRARFVATDLDRWPAVDVRPVEGTWPNTDAVIPKADEARFSIAVNPYVLARTLTTLADALGMKGERYPAVVIRFYTPLSALRLDATAGSNGGQGTALVMPIRHPSKDKDQGGTPQYRAEWSRCQKA